VRVVWCKGTDISDSSLLTSSENLKYHGFISFRNTHNFPFRSFRFSISARVVLVIMSHRGSLHLPELNRMGRILCLRILLSRKDVRVKLFQCTLCRCQKTYSSTLDGGQFREAPLRPRKESWLAIKLEAGRTPERVWTSAEECNSCPDRNPTKILQPFSTWPSHYTYCAIPAHKTMGERLKHTTLYVTKGSLSTHVACHVPFSEITEVKFESKAHILSFHEKNEMRQ
jgi:hypothetical protein